MNEKVFRFLDTEPLTSYYEASHLVTKQFAVTEAQAEELVYAWAIAK